MGEADTTISSIPLCWARACPVAETVKSKAISAPTERVLLNLRYIFLSLIILVRPSQNDDALNGEVFA